jgi:trehalose/maltose hydrolase-like predicted phosphorylase
MRTRLLVVAVAAASGVTGLGAAPAAAAPAAAVPAVDAGFVLSTTQPGGPGFAPAFVGNGYLAGRQPADGQGFGRVQLPGQAQPLATQSEVHGLYGAAAPSAPPGSPPQPPVERRAALPAWSTLRYDDGSGPYSLATGRVAGYRQQLDLRTGTLTTSVNWTSPAGRTVDLRYDVTPDRARPHAASVRLRLVPRFAGRVTVTDLLDGQAAELLTGRGTGHRGATQWLRLSTVGLGVPATLASTLDGPGSVQPLPQADPLSAAQQVAFTVRAGQSYEVTKSVGVAVGTDSRDPVRAALAAARTEARLGYRTARRASDAAWAELWRSDIAVAGDARLQQQVRAAFFALLASVRDGVPWAPSPGGLSSDGYNGHVFWDSETWMYPTLLATEPALARESLAYRAARIPAARRYSAATGTAGTRFPWESALSGDEETPAFANTGKWEIHVNADIALAAWQYWLATGDRAWLARTGWPLLSGIAGYYASRADRDPDGTYHIRTVIPPNEYVEQVDDSAYTNVGARDALDLAGRAAAILRRAAPPRWAAVARGLVVPFDGTIHPEYAGYPGDAVKQADVTLLSYPWENPQPAAVTAADLDYYVPRTDPGGPSMTDAINSIVSSRLGRPGCAAFTFTRRSVDPFMRGPYQQFSEARTGGAFTFTTGAGGFLQEFLYGYTGLRWRADRIQLDPSLPPQLTGITAAAVHWQGRTVRIEVGPHRTVVTLLGGAPVPVESPAGTAQLRPGAPLVLPTRRPDLAPTDNLARCRPAVADPATAEPPEAAVDGTATSQWIGPSPGAQVRVDLGGTVPLGHLTVTRAPVTTVPVEGGPGRTVPTASAGMRVEASTDGTDWRPVATVAAPTLRDEIPGDGRPARWIRLVALDASTAHPLIVGDLAVRRA